MQKQNHTVLPSDSPLLSSEFSGTSASLPSVWIYFRFKKHKKTFQEIICWRVFAVDILFSCTIQSASLHSHHSIRWHVVFLLSWNYKAQIQILVISYWKFMIQEINLTRNFDCFSFFSFLFDVCILSFWTFRILLAVSNDNSRQKV